MNKDNPTQAGASPAASPKLLSYADVAREYGLKLGTLYSMVQKWTIPHTRIGPRLVRFHRDELDRWLAANTVAPPAR